MDLAHASRVVSRPHISEKGTRLTRAHNQFVFEVALWASKPEIRQAIERLFKVSVLDVRTMRLAGKEKGLRHRGRRPDRKKAVVTLKSGDKIDFIPGV